MLLYVWKQDTCLWWPEQTVFVGVEKGREVVDWEIWLVRMSCVACGVRLWICPMVEREQPLCKKKVATARPLLGTRGRLNKKNLDLHMQEAGNGTGYCWQKKWQDQYYRIKQQGIHSFFVPRDGQGWWFAKRCWALSRHLSHMPRILSDWWWWENFRNTYHVGWDSSIHSIVCAMRRVCHGVFPPRLSW